MNQEELLGEVEDILRTMPPRETLRHPTDDNFAWLGRVSAFIEAWDPPKQFPLGTAMHQFHGQVARDAQEGLRKILTLLHQARHDLRMKTIGPVNAAMGHGRVFDYFDEVRKIIEPAKQDLFFIHPEPGGEIAAGPENFRHSVEELMKDPAWCEAVGQRLAQVGGHGGLTGRAGVYALCYCGSRRR